MAAEVSLDNFHATEMLPTLLNPLQRKLGRVHADGAYDSKTSHQLIAVKRARACTPPCNKAGQQGRAGALEEDIEISPPLAGRDGDVSVQVAGGENQPA